MTRDDIISMAREAGFTADVSDDGKPYQNAFGKSVPVEWLERFAAIVAAAIRARGNKSNEAQDANG